MRVPIFLVSIYAMVIRSLLDEIRKMALCTIIALIFACHYAY